MRNVFLAAMCSALTVVAAPADAFTFTTIDVPGATYTVPHGINDRGDIVGAYGLPDGTRHSFLLKDGIYTSIDVPDARFSEAFDINNRGQIVGYYLPQTGAQTFGFVWSGGKLTSIPPQDFGESVIAYGINDRGEVVGEIGSQNFGKSGFVRDTYGILTRFDLDALFTFFESANDRGKVVGLRQFDDAGPDRTQGFLIDLDRPDHFVPINVPGATATRPFGINDQKEIVGSFVRNGTAHAFLRDNRGDYTKINVPHAIGEVAEGINNRGDVIGSYGADGTTHGFVREDGNPKHSRFRPHDDDDRGERQNARQEHDERF